MRYPTAEDIPAVIDLASSIKLFDSDEEINDLIRKPLEEYLAQGPGTSQWWVQTGEDDSRKSGNGSATIVSASFTGPQLGEDGTFNLFFIGVRPEVQKKGLGAAMVTKVEEWAKKEHGAERLLVETASHMDDAQAFYKKTGFVERKRMKDMYGVGIDAIQFVKEL
jgi:ribosomal protein S18 acetylase RimI-like enzyme